MRKGGKIGKRALFPMLVVLLMVAGSFGAQVFVQDSVTDTGTAAEDAISEESATVTSWTGETETTESLDDATITQAEHLGIDMPTAFRMDPNGERAWDYYGNDVELDPEMKGLEMHYTEKSTTSEEVVSESTSEGTRASYLDFNGPYGTIDDPFWEGTTVTFIVKKSADMQFLRFDFNADGTFDTGWINTGASTLYTYDYLYLDDFYGGAIVEGWDGVSYTYETGDGKPLKEGDYTWYLGDGYYYTFGWQFEAEQTVTVTELGVMGVYYPYYIYNLRLWTDSGSMLMEVRYPPARTYDWRWYNDYLGRTPTLIAGQLYRVSIGARGYNMPGVDNPGSDGFINPIRACYYYGSQNYFPSTLWQDYALPTVDIHYTYQFKVPDVLVDAADVWVENLPPNVWGVEVDPAEGWEGKNVSVTAWFDDPGLGDTWEYMIEWGDGTDTGWLSIPMGQGMYALTDVLIWDDNQEGRHVQALDELATEYGFGYTYCAQADIACFYNNLNAQTWDLIVADNYWIVYTNQNTHYDPLVDQYEAGAQIIWFSWGIGPYHNDGHEFFQLLGADYVSYYTSPIPWWEWDPAHDAFTKKSPFPGPEFPTQNVFWTDGQLWDWDSAKSHAPAGHTPSEQANTAAMLVKNDHKIVLNGFTSDSYHTWDSDLDGIYDMVEMYKNQIMMVVEACHGPTQKFAMPYQLPWTNHIYEDDDPVTATPYDEMEITVYVKDDDHCHMSHSGVLWEHDFEDGTFGGMTTGGTGYSWQNFGWMNGPSYQLTPGRSALNWYYYGSGSGFTAWMRTPSINTLVSPVGTPYLSLELSFDYYWWANYGSGDTDGYVRVTDGIGPFTTVWERHHNNPGVEGPATATIDISAFVGPDTIIEWWVYQRNDWLWEVDEIQLSGFWGKHITGIDSDTGTVTIHNCIPVLKETPPPLEVKENKEFTISGLEIYDQALRVDTEWYAYKYDFDDGTESPWFYKSSGVTPSLKVLVIHTWGGYEAGIRDQLEDTGIVTEVNFWNYLSFTVPTLAYALEYDVIIHGINSFYTGGYAPWEAAKLAVGNLMADFLDAKPDGGVITMVATFITHPVYGEAGTLTGRYMDEKYGAFESVDYVFGAIGMGEVYEDAPFFTEIMRGAIGDVTDLTAELLYGGDFPMTDPDMPTPGGTTSKLADWSNGNTAIGAKETGAGARSVNINVFAGLDGDHLWILLGNSMYWVTHTYIFTPKLPDIVHNYGDNGVYNIDVMLIDDDMGWAWDPIAGEPVPAVLPPGYEGYEPEISHNIITVEVQNCDPVITCKEAYVMADLGLRMTGEKSNEATLTVYANDVVIGQVTVHRYPGAPSEGFIKNVKIDMTYETTYRAEVFYNPENDQGANPTWLMTIDFPDSGLHGKTLKHLFKSADGPTTWVIDNSQLKRELADQEITFKACAKDQGSDDLAFVWVWGDSMPYGLNLYSHEFDMLWAANVPSEIPEFLPWEEPPYVFAMNDIRTPSIDPIAVVDYNKHKFQTGYVYYAVIIVMDDDVDDWFPAHQPWNIDNHPGTDMDFLVLDLR